MLKRTALLFSLITVAFLFNCEKTFAQDRWWKEKKYKYESARIKYDLCKKTFKDISSGLSYKNINLINPYFDSQVYLNVISSEKGYYSSSQAELILIDFMDSFSIENFKYKRSSTFNSYAFANGVYTYRVGSGKRNLKVTISLKYKYKTWYVDQITIN